jgi:hypothetical protein
MIRIRFRIQIEALACQEIFNQAEDKKVKLIWSFMHEDETLLCPFPDRQTFAFELSTLCPVRVGPEKLIYTLAQTLSQKGKFSAKDILHVACAAHAQANYFITCDDALLRQAKKLDLSLLILNPVDYIRQ